MVIVRSMGSTEVLARWLIKVCWVLTPFVLVALLFTEYPVMASIALVLAVGTYFLLGEMLYRRRLKARLARRDARIVPFEEGGMDEFNRCIEEINGLVRGGSQRTTYAANC